jgi:ABC-type transport system substrate-binding protein
MKTREIRRILGATIFLSVVLLFGDARAADAPVYGGTLKIAMRGLDTSDPHRHGGSISVQQVYVEALTSIADDGSVKPFLAETYQVSPDGRTYTFTLRKGVRFHNGREMTSEDVRKNFLRVKEVVTKGWLSGAMKLVENMAAPDDTTFIVTLKEPYAPFLNLVSELWILAPESPGWGETITQPIGTGPFKFGKWVPKVELIAPKHETYWQSGRPYLDEVRFDLRDDVDNNLTLRAGDLHVGRANQEQIQTLLKDPNLGVQYLKDTTWYFWSFNNRSPRPPLDNPRVRAAIAYALDKPAYMSFIAGAAGIATNQMVIPGHFYFDQALHDADRHAKPNLENAKRMLKEAGVDPATVKLEIISWQFPYAEVAVQMIKKLGFQVNHLPLDDLGAQKRLEQYDWDVAVLSSGPRADIFLRYVRMMSDGPGPELWGGVKNADYDALIKLAVAEVDPGKRRQLYLKAWDLVMQNYWTVVAGHAADAIGVRKDVHGYTTGYTWSQHRVDGGLAQTWLAAKPGK